LTQPLFPAWTTSAFRFALALVALIAVSVPVLAMIVVRTPYETGQREVIVQPIKFDHRHHVRDDGIDCTYCHAGVTRSAYAGVPAVSVCMGCHAQIWTSSPELSLLREAYFKAEPIEWVRVTNLPRHVFFNHAIHVAKGVGCVTCHGRVDQMGQVYQEHTMLMQWCLACHRHPEDHLRPLSEITDMEWTPSMPQLELGRALVKELDVHPTIDCTGCHR
jgi:hypothetical protein